MTALAAGHTLTEPDEATTTMSGLGSPIKSPTARPLPLTAYSTSYSVAHASYPRYGFPPQVVKPPVSSER